MSQTAYVKYLQELLINSKIEHLSQKEFEVKYEQPKITQNNAENQADVANNESTTFKLDHNMQPELTGKLVERYSRQMLLKEISYQGQLKIINSKVAVIGCGGIGCPLALYLAGAGIGHLGLFDSDSVEVTNLHRQIGHNNLSIGMKKTQSLANTLLAFNPNIKITQHQFITVESCSELADYDLIIDGSDNPECRYIVNDFCMKSGKRLLSGACIGWQGQVTCYGGKQAPCYRCIWGNEQKTNGGCSTLGVVGMLPGFVGIILAIEAIKVIVNGTSSLEGSLLTYESKSATFRKCKLRPRVKDCIGCGSTKLDMSAYDYQSHAICKPNLSNLPKVGEIEWAQLLRGQFSGKILDVRPTNQFEICHLKNMVNIPYAKLSELPYVQLIEELQKAGLIKKEKVNERILVSCNRGIMSKRAVDLLNQAGLNGISVKGGISEYSNLHDSDVPLL